MKVKLFLCFIVLLPVFSYGQISFVTTDHFKNIKLYDSVLCPPVSDQSLSPTCWAFGTHSLFEADLIKKYKLNLNLSEMFIARHAHIDRINIFLKKKGASYSEGGGYFHDVIRMIEKYGAVPEEAYTGRPNGEKNHDHTALENEMQIFANKLLETGKTSINVTDLDTINNILDKHLGKLPLNFLYKGKSYTPKTFARDVLKFKNDYVEMVSFDDKPYYKMFILEDKYNWALDSFYNVPLNELVICVDTAIARGWSLGWSGDVTEPGFEYSKGLAWLTSEELNYDAERIINYKDQTTERDHMLHIVGIAKDDDNNKWYYMKNSWGNYNIRNGYLYMKESYFKLKTVIIQVNKNALPQELKKKLKIL